MNNFEKQTTLLVNNLIEARRPQFEENGLTISDTEFRSSGDSIHFFSEIECDIWKENNIVAVFSIVLYLEGRQLLTINEVDIEANTELDRLLFKLIGGSVTK